MDKSSLIQFIQQILPMSAAGLEQIITQFYPCKIERNECVVTAGKVCNASYFIEKGIMRSYTYNYENEEITTAFHQVGTYASDLLSFFKRTPAKEYIQAITDCETWFITYEDMQESFHAIPEFREFGRLNIVNQYNVLKERMLSNLQETAEKRYSDLVHSSPDIIQQVPLKYIASYLGVADTSLSRIRKEFSKK